MAHSVFELTEWLERQKGRDLIINKGELSTGSEEITDIDQVRLHLDDFSVRSIEKHDIDDYLADQEIILHGQGQIISDQGKIELPQNVYEIPIVGNMRTQNEENGMKVKTQQAVYTILIQ